MPVLSHRRQGGTVLPKIQITTPGNLCHSSDLFLSDIFFGTVSSSAVDARKDLPLKRKASEEPEAETSKRPSKRASDFYDKEGSPHRRGSDEHR